MKDLPREWNQLEQVEYLDDQLKIENRYVKYIGDRDSTSYDAIAAEKPYGEDHEIKKFECVGHVQKRVGTHLHELRKIT